MFNPFIIFSLFFFIILLSNDNQDYYENSFSNNDCFINSNPIYNYNDINISKLSNAISIKSMVLSAT